MTGDEKRQAGAQHGSCAWLGHLLSRSLALVGGLSVLVLAIYISVDVVLRNVPESPTLASGEIGGYILALASAWGCSYALVTGSHVRIDVLLPYLPAKVRFALDYAAIAVIGGFCLLLAIITGQVCIESYRYEATSIGILRAPLWAPQGALSLGFLAAALQAAVIVVLGAILSIRNARLVPLEALLLSVEMDEPAMTTAAVGD